MFGRGEVKRSSLTVLNNTKGLGFCWWAEDLRWAWEGSMFGSGLWFMVLFGLSFILGPFRLLCVK